jgi:hypothetical protein
MKEARMRQHRRGRSKARLEASEQGNETDAPEGLALASPALKFSPVSLFTVATECRRKTPSDKDVHAAAYELPNMGPVCGEESFATVFLGWDSTGIWGAVKVDQPYERASFPDVTSGDSFELFIDTRDSKTSGFIHRFCHHFFFLPAAVNGHVAGEITRFRTEDAHEWCDAKELKVTTKTQKDGYVMHWMIPAHCLHGYDPEQFDRLGFTYRINRAGGSSQHFAVVSNDFQMDQQPSLWASMRLIS